MNLPPSLCRLAVIALVAAWPAAGGAQTGDPARTVETASGAVAGIASGAESAFLGIPFAQAPVGALRWREPQPVTRWEGIRSADTFGPPCAQAALRGMTAVSSISSEDCLYLNIWTPGQRTDDALPVMVWIHGGGFQNGMGTSPTYDGAALAARGVIVVTLNYRLGVFGFLAHPLLTAEDPRHASGNWGLQDQIAALRWVRRNIAAFGGDPANVTLFGQSAGGASVYDLISSRQADGLFARAIIESGAARAAIVATPLATAEEAGSAFAGDASLADLRTLDTAAVLERAGASGARFGPVLDGFVIEADAATVLAERQRRGLALLIGSNSREGLSVLPDERLESAVRSEFGANADRALAIYFGEGDAVDPLLGTPAQQFATDTTFRCGNVQVAPGKRQAGAPTWQYQFDHFVPGRGEQGSAHSFEVPYVFGNLSRTGFSAADYGPADASLAAVMGGYWTNFARRGDPNGPGLPDWPRYDANGRAYVRLTSAVPEYAAVGHDLRGEICPLLPATQPESE